MATIAGDNLSSSTVSSPKLTRQRIQRIIRYTFVDFLHDDCPKTAAALTYQTLFAVVPLLTVTYRLFSAFAAFDGMERQIEDFVFSNFVPETGDVVKTYLHDFSSQAIDLTTAGVALLAVAAIAMLITIERAFNDIWRIDEPRSGLSRFLLYWAVLTLGPFCVVLAMSASAYIAALPFVVDVSGSTFFLKMVPLVMSAIVFTLIYVAVPNCKVPLLHGITGGILVALLFELAKVTFIKIVAQSSYQVIYGAFATVPLFLLWIYLAWNLVLFGAVMVRNMGVPHHISFQSEEHFLQLLAILELFNQAHHKGESVNEDRLCYALMPTKRENWNHYRKLLQDMKVIERTTQGDFLLCRNLADITLWELLQKIPWQLPVNGYNDNVAWRTVVDQKLTKIAEVTREGLDISLAELFDRENS